MSHSVGDGKLEESTIHDVLGNDRRRLVIEVLREAEGVAELGDLAEAVAVRESGIEPPPSDSRQSVYVSLHQTHLPKLDSLGIIEYDADRRDVRLGDRVAEIEVYMDVVPRVESPWAESYLAWGLLGLVTVTASRVGVPVVSAVSPATVAAVFFICLMFASAYHAYSYRGQTVFGRLLG